ncbi:MAG: hypothetical protein FAF03_05430 [Epsilonproteobacteria bacterium]|nr:hypothetical protein [Campylobacterota bacterium]
MKKALLLSVVASTMIMAGGDIAPVEPVVEAPVVETSGWDFGGKGVVYYQTNDTIGISGAATGDLFSQEASAADAGIQLTATNKDLFAGVGAGVTVNGLATLGLENDIVSNVMQSVYGNLTGGWIAESYLTYGAGNTMVKVGRQTLPKSLSPMAYSENWNVFENTFDAALIVNSSLPNTTLVGAWVWQQNGNGMHQDMATFGKLNGDRGVFMLTAQNKSISDVTLTGSYYFASEFAAGNDLSILWGDAAYNAGGFNLGVQAATLMSDAFATDPVIWGVKVGTTLAGINLGAAYSDVQDTWAHQVGGSTSAVYTTTALDQVKPAANTWTNETKFTLSASAAALGGNITGVFANSENDYSDYNEFDLVYSTNLTDSINLTAAYVYADLDALSDTINLVRVVGSYKF